MSGLQAEYTAALRKCYEQKYVEIDHKDCAEIADTIDAQAARIAELEAIVEKLPKTADGVPVVPGMTLWTPPLPTADESEHGIVLWIQKQGVNRDHPCVGLDKGHGQFSCPLAWCYSTRAAAEAAHRLANAPHDHDHMEGDKQ